MGPETAEPEVEFPELTDATAEEDDEDDEDDIADVIGPADYPKVEVKNVIAGALDRFAASNLDAHKQLDQAQARLMPSNLGALTEIQGTDS